MFDGSEKNDSSVYSKDKHVLRCFFEYLGK